MTLYQRLSEKEKVVFNQIDECLLKLDYGKISVLLALVEKYDR